MAPWNSTRPSSLARQLKPAGFDCFADLAAWRSWQADNRDRLEARWLIAQQLRGALDGPEYQGWCEVCGSAVRFRVSDVPQLAGVWYFRDDAVCSSCRLMGRLRLGALLLRQLLPSPDAEIYVNEQLSGLYVWLLKNYPRVAGSEYLPDGALTSGLRRWKLQRRLNWLLGELGSRDLLHEDATALSFSDARFSALMSFDVLEHIPDYPAALREFARVLKPGGVAILTAPFLDNDQQTRVRARQLADGTIEHLLPAEYHGDPAAGGNQILCYQDFGWDILESLRGAGFSEACTVSYWNVATGFPSQVTAWVARR